MCGITGIINLRGKVRNPLAILRMEDSIAHRGPDAVGHYISPEGHVVFGHRRLSLVGLDSRATVMSIPKKDNPKHEVSIVFNGEIYNFLELKEYFKKKGYVSVSPSDFEVIIFAWQEWGADCVDYLIGEFVFVIYDEQTKKTFIARDRTGVKPLFYTFTKCGEFVFGSEPKAILQYPDIDRKMDVNSVAEFLLMGHTFAAGLQSESSSYYENIKQLPPAYKAVLDKKGFRLNKYWDIPISDKKNKKNNVKEVRKALSESVAKRIPLELPISVGLSGGLDSSIIAALVKKNKHAQKVLASCVRYTGDPNIDYKHAKILAKMHNIKLVSPNVSPEKMMGLINRCINSVDGPVDSIRRMGMHANYEMISKLGYKATLIGEGADEFNLGYYHKFPGLKLDKDHCKTAASVRAVFRSRAKYVSRFFTKRFLAGVNFNAIIKDIVAKNYEACKSKDPVTRMQYFYARKFLLYLEDGNDRAAASYSVEARLPFVDPKVIKTCLAVPMEENIVDSGEKQVLRDAFKDILPKEIYLRAKAPFPANEDMKLHKLISKAFEKEIKNASPEVWKILDKKFVVGLSQRFKKRIKDLEKEYGPGNGGRFLTAWLPISQEVEIRTNHVFSVLTFIRWYQMNFTRP